MDQAIKIVIMVVVGALSGTLAARVVKGNNYGFIVNSILGIAGAVVGGYIYDFLGLEPGKHIVKIIADTFEVSLPQNIVGMVVSATVGAILILFVVGLVKKK